MRAILNISVLLFAALISGCANNVSQSVYDKETQVAKTTIVKAASVEEAMDRCRGILREMGFKFDKFDTANGYLRTEALGGSQFFEFWRDDNVGTYNTAMANINSIARIVEMSFKASGSSVYVDCKAHINQLSVETGDLNGVSDMKNAFTKSSGGFQRLTLRSGDAQWISLGRDVMLEDMILFEVRK